MALLSAIVMEGADRANPKTQHGRMAATKVVFAFLRVFVSLWFALRNKYH
jgi:hypothetical protein